MWGEVGWGGAGQGGAWGNAGWCGMGRLGVMRRAVPCTLISDSLTLSAQQELMYEARPFVRRPFTTHHSHHAHHYSPRSPPPPPPLLTTADHHSPPLTTTHHHSPPLARSSCTRCTARVLTGFRSTLPKLACGSASRPRVGSLTPSSRWPLAWESGRSGLRKTNLRAPSGGEGRRFRAVPLHRLSWRGTMQGGSRKSAGPAGPRRSSGPTEPRTRVTPKRSSCSGWPITRPRAPAAT